MLLYQIHNTYEGNDENTPIRLCRSRSKGYIKVHSNNEINNVIKYSVLKKTFIRLLMNLIIV
jgi:hypothetical protein